MKILFTLIISFSILISSAQETISYPVAPQADVIDTLWGQEVSDPFRPLEKDDEARKEWLKEEKQTTNDYLKTINHKFDIDFDYRHTVYNSNGIFYRSGPYYIEYRWGFTGNQVDVYYKDYLRDPGRFLYSPSMISAKVTKFTDVKMSADGSYCALMYSPDGSDWQEIRIYNMNTMALIKDHIKNVRYSDISWYQNGFFYNRFDSVNDATKYTDVVKNQKVCYHKIGTDPATDAVVFDDQENPLDIFKVKTTDDERFVIISEEFTGENKTVTYFKDNTKNLPFQVLVTESTTKTSVIGSKKDTLFAITTNGGAYNGKIVEIDTKHPATWGLILDNQQKYLIKQGLYVNNTFCLILQQGFSEFMGVISAEGEIIKTMRFADGSDNAIICYSPDQNSLILSKQYYICPAIGDLFSLKDFSLKSIAVARYINFDAKDYEFYLTNYRSKDGTPVPIYVVMKKGNIKNGPAPTLLSIYGGFGNTPRASFDPALLSFLNNGGVYAFANIRGGANSSKDWHTSGKGLNKQNSIDDTYYAARFLIDSGISKSDKIAITGTSNGALIAAAVINQHPELFKVAILNAGLYDMVRYENFTAGIYFETEYGSVDADGEFKNLLSYSPLHNIRKNTAYPAMWITTSEFDDRVPALHTYKYVATLQKFTNSKKPILLRVTENQGHNSSGSYYEREEAKKLSYAFLFNELDIKYKPFSFYSNK